MGGYKVSPSLTPPPPSTMETTTTTATTTSTQDAQWSAIVDMIKTVASPAVLAASLESSDQITRRPLSPTNTKKRARQEDDESDDESLASSSSSPSKRTFVEEVARPLFLAHYVCYPQYREWLRESAPIWAHLCMAAYVEHVIDFRTKAGIQRTCDIELDKSLNMITLTPAAKETDKRDVIHSKIPIGDLGSEFAKIVINANKWASVEKLFNKPKGYLFECTFTLANGTQRSYFNVLYGEREQYNAILSSDVEAITTAIRFIMDEEIKIKDINDRMCAARIRTHERTMPAGQYFVGDPCYACPDSKWDGVLESTKYFSEPLQFINDLPTFCYPTWHGDGKYEDEFCVDSGTFGIIPMAVIRQWNKGCKPKESRLKTFARCGRVITFEKDFVASLRQGKFVFGSEVSVDTNTSHVHAEDSESEEEEEDF
jgi:hypothetical protein